MKVRVKQTGELLEVAAIVTVEEKINQIGQHVLHYNFFKPDEVEIIEEQKESRYE